MLYSPEEEKGLPYILPQTSEKDLGILGTLVISEVATLLVFPGEGILRISFQGKRNLKSPNTNQGPLESHETPLSGDIPFCLSLLGSAYLLALHDETPGPTLNSGS